MRIALLVKEKFESKRNIRFNDMNFKEIVYEYN